MPDERSVADLLQEVLGLEYASNGIRNGILDAFTHLASALAWTDNNPNRAEYARSLLDLHRDEPNPVLASIITAASWLGDAA